MLNLDPERIGNDKRNICLFQKINEEYTWFFTRLFSVVIDSIV